ncbi:MAG: hypothetical protein Q7U04_12165 [Bacteriovorax sp.]|nr:hypothetical protein [Bacteriovorax sp.]
MKSRSGSYKKILIDPQTLKAQGAYLRDNLFSLNKLHLSPQDFTTLYIILFLRIKHPKNWIQRNSKVENSESDKNKLIGIKILNNMPETFCLNEWEKEKLNGLSTYSLYTGFNLKAIPLSINKTMINWYQGNWSIEKLEHIPSPRELLRLQVKNSRCITVITNPNEIDSLVLNSRDPLSFVLHDLMHADQFFSQTESQKGQLGFYQLINSIYDYPELRIILKNNEVFKNEFEYVAADMNAYVIHLFKCLKSAIARIDSDGSFFIKVLSWWKMSDSEQNSAHKLNTPDFNLVDEIILKEFFEKNQEVLS